MTIPRYRWAVLQTGELPLRPSGEVMRVEHRCTIPLIWAEDGPPGPGNTLLVDPCFTEAGLAEANTALESLGLTLKQIGQYFVTHPHGDHLPYLPGDPVLLRLMDRFRPDQAADGPLRGLATAHYPGHDPCLRALTFTASDGQRVWVVGDAVLDGEWLRAWGYYWPNAYSPPDVVDTWRSVAAIIAGADVIVPGHGLPIAVTAVLVGDLLAAFPRAEHADQCPEVAELLRARLHTLEEREAL